MNEVILKSILEALESINLNLSSQVEQLERLNDNIENVTGTFKDRSFLNVAGSIHVD